MKNKAEKFGKLLLIGCFALVKSSVPHLSKTSKSYPYCGYFVLSSLQYPFPFLLVRKGNISFYFLRGIFTLQSSFSHFPMCGSGEDSLHGNLVPSYILLPAVTPEGKSQGKYL